MEKSIESLIHKSLENRMTESEQNALQSWIREHPDNEVEFESFRILATENLMDEGDAGDFESGRRRFMSIIGLLESKQRMKIRLRTFLSILLLAATLTASIWHLLREFGSITETQPFGK